MSHQTHSSDSSRDNPAHESAHFAPVQVNLSEMMRSSQRIIDEAQQQLGQADGEHLNNLLAIMKVAALERSQAAVQLHLSSPGFQLQEITRFQKVEPGSLQLSVGQKFLLVESGSGIRKRNTFIPLPPGSDPEKVQNQSEAILFSGLFYETAPGILERFKDLSDVRALLAFYRPSAIPGVYALEEKQLSKPNWNDRAVELCALFRKLSGADPDHLQETLHAFEGAIPIVPGPLYRAVGVLNQQISYGHFPQFRIPYGQLECSRNFLLSMQRRIEEGEIHKYTVSLTGRLDPELVHWCEGTGIQDPGPIPDIEIIYAVVLPSGRRYSFAIHAAREYSTLENENMHGFLPEDAAVVRKIGEYFADPGHSASWEIFSQFRLSDYPPELHPYLADPGLQWNADTYLQVIQSWSTSVVNQLLEEPAYRGKRFRDPQWLRLPEWNYETCLALLRERLGSMPFEQDYRPSDYYIVPDAQVDQFLDHYAPDIYGITQRERDRVASERASGRIEERTANGWLGPDEGMAASLDIYLIDAIEDSKRRKSYIEIKQAEQGPANTTPILVPEQIGRRYNIPAHKILSLSEVAARLAVAKPRRTVEVSLTDPLTKSTEIVTDLGKVRSLRGLLLEKNIERLKPHVDAHIRSILAGEGDQAALPHVQRFLTLEKALLEQERDRRATLEKKIGEQKTQMATVSERARALGKVGQDIVEFSRSEKRRFEQAIRSSQEGLYDVQDTYVEMLSAISPQFARENCLRIDRIVDEDMIKFIYAVDANDRVGLDEEVLLPGGGFRRLIHLQLVHGGCAFPAGEIVFARHREVLMSLKNWGQLDAQLRTQPLSPYQPIEFNNFSGHLAPPAPTLAYGKHVVFPQLEAAGFSIKNCQVVNRLAPGLRFRSLSIAKI